MKQKVTILTFSLIALIVIGAVFMNSSRQQDQPLNSDVSANMTDAIAEETFTTEEYLPSEEDEAFEDEPIPVTDSTKARDAVDSKADDEKPAKEQSNVKPQPDNEEMGKEENTTQTIPGEVSEFFGGKFETGEDEF